MDHADLRVARAFGDGWIHERRTPMLVVPSVVARREGNMLINPQHHDFSGVVARRPEPVVWDARLFDRH
jgi:RES domain-containing protein